ncbi:hypothetical protein DIPPA_23948 [Diplonema papillatum]|nr:hypothetical protein DIPPA_23948 [Diplonema papillatum]
MKKSKPNAVRYSPFFTTVPVPGPVSESTGSPMDLVSSQSLIESPTPEYHLRQPSEASFTLFSPGIEVGHEEHSDYIDVSVNEAAAAPDDGKDLFDRDSDSFPPTSPIIPQSTVALGFFPTVINVFSKTTGLSLVASAYVLQQAGVVLGIAFTIATAGLMAYTAHLLMKLGKQTGHHNFETLSMSVLGKGSRDLVLVLTVALSLSAAIMALVLTQDTLGVAITEWFGGFDVDVAFLPGIHNERLVLVILSVTVCLPMCLLRVFDEFSPRRILTWFLLWLGFVVALLVALSGAHATSSHSASKPSLALDQSLSSTAQRLTMSTEAALASSFSSPPVAKHYRTDLVGARFVQGFGVLLFCFCTKPYVFAAKTAMANSEARVWGWSRVSSIASMLSLSVFLGVATAGTTVFASCTRPNLLNNFERGDAAGMVARTFMGLAVLLLLPTYLHSARHAFDRFSLGGLGSLASSDLRRCISTVLLLGGTTTAALAMRPDDLGFLMYFSGGIFGSAMGCIVPALCLFAHQQKGKSDSCCLWLRWEALLPMVLILLGVVTLVAVLVIGIKEVAAGVEFGPAASCPGI